LVTRILRHDVGDLLQTVYASVAILERRLPVELELERRILGDLRKRAEICKQMLDTVHDLVCPVSIANEEVDVSGLAPSLVYLVQPRYPQLEIRAQTQPTPPIQSDPRHLTQIGSRLLAHACERAQREVWFRSGPGPAQGEVRWTVADDGSALPPEQLETLFEPFQTTRPGPHSLDLGLARRLVQLHFGRISADNLPSGGLVITVLLPATPPRMNEE
jgi:signal transduction histidine kinase